MVNDLYVLIAAGVALGFIDRRCSWIILQCDYLPPAPELLLINLNVVFFILRFGRLIRAPKARLLQRHLNWTRYFSEARLRYLRLPRSLLSYTSAFLQITTIIWYSSPFSLLQLWKLFLGVVLAVGFCSLTKWWWPFIEEVLLREGSCLACDMRHRKKTISYCFLMLTLRALVNSCVMGLAAICLKWRTAQKLIIIVFYNAAVFAIQNIKSKWTSFERGQVIIHSYFLV